MIVSASYRTDIPAFYGRWFLRRLDAGFCRTSNPYNRRVSTVSLRAEDVDGFVFWTKNLGPFLEPLSTIRSRGYPFVVQYTITGYPRELEQAVISWERSCNQAAETAARFGPHVVVWRYDPILVTSLTPASFHIDRFAAIAERLAGVVDEVVVSWTQMYKKTMSNLAKTGLEVTDPPDADKRDLVTRLAAEASRHRIALTVCSQAAYASAPGARPARCIDAARLGDIRGEPLAAKTLGNRPDCECHESRDIGEYDTCPHGCVYCYAVRSSNAAHERLRDHDLDSEFLFDPRPDVG